MKKGSIHVFIILLLVIVSFVLIWKFTSASASSFKYVALGDSVTAGTGVNPGEEFVSKYTNFLSTDLHTPVEKVNLGTPQWFSSMLLDAVKNNQTFRNNISSANVITLYIGLNNYQTSRSLYLNPSPAGPVCQQGLDPCFSKFVADTTSDYTQIISEIKSLNNDPKTVIRTMTVYNPFVNDDIQSGNFDSFNPYLIQFNNNIKSIAASNGILVADLYTAFNGTDGRQDAGANGLLLIDSILHPTNAGHTVIANNLRSLGYSQVDQDADQILDSIDNCPTVANSNQINANSETIPLPKPKYPFDDLTNAIGDNVGDACDADIDHDGLTNAQEATLGTNANNPDTDNDGILDGGENKCGSDPLLATNTIKSGAMVGGIRFVTAGTSSNPDTDNDGVSDSCEAIYGSNPNVKDTDGDKIVDSVEILKLGTNPTKTDTDADNCDDAIEVAGINGDRVVNSGDQGLLSSMVAVTAKKGDANYVQDFDLNRDGAINSGDQGFMLSQVGKSCPTPPPPANP